jgi:hypothetical protein
LSEPSASQPVKLQLGAGLPKGERDSCVARFYAVVHFVR